MLSKVSKIVLIGIMGNGKSSVANIFAGKEYFEVSNGVDSCTLKIESYKNGDIEIFDTEGLNNESNKDVKNLQKMINKFKEEQMNAIFIVNNGEICRIDDSLEKVIKQICNLFVGKYIWKQIGIIFTHYGTDIEEQEEMRGREKKYVKKILQIAEDEYKNIVSKQQSGDFKICDPNEKLVDSLECFYVNAKKKKNRYDDHTLKEIEKIKNLVRQYPPITKIQSKFEIKRELLKDQRGDPVTIIQKQLKTGFVPFLKRIGCYAWGTLNAINTPTYLLLSGACKTIGLAFDENSTVNKMGNVYLECIKYTPQIFTKCPEELIGKEITGSITKYDIYDLEIIYYSNLEIEKNIKNIRHQEHKNG